jgi:hypothetical protein
LEVAGCRQKMMTQNDVVKLVIIAEMMGYETEIVILFLVLEDCMLVVENGSSRLASRNIGSIGLLFSCDP